MFPSHSNSQIQWSVTATEMFLIPATISMFCLASSSTASASGGISASLSLSDSWCLSKISHSFLLFPPLGGERCLFFECDTWFFAHLLFFFLSLDFGPISLSSSHHDLSSTLHTYPYPSPPLDLSWNVHCCQSSSCTFSLIAWMALIKIGLMKMATFKQRKLTCMLLLWICWCCFD